VQISTRAASAVLYSNIHTKFKSNILCHHHFDEREVHGVRIIPVPPTPPPDNKIFAPINMKRGTKSALARNENKHCGCVAVGIRLFCKGNTSASPRPNRVVCFRRRLFSHRQCLFATHCHISMNLPSRRHPLVNEICTKPCLSVCVCAWPASKNISLFSVTRSRT
jgi:hypothetical protein